MCCVCRVGEFGRVLRAFRQPARVGVARRGRGLKAAAGEKGRARVSTLKPIRRKVARAGAVIISGRETKKMSFSAKKNTKNAPRRIKTRARAFIYRRARVFCLPSARAGAYIAGIMATRAKKTAPKAAAKSATAAELVPVKRRRGAPLGNRNAAGNRGGGAPRGNRNAAGHKNALGNRGGRPRAGGAGAEAYSVKINLAITPTQRRKLDTAAENAGIKFADFLRNFIDSL